MALYGCDLSRWQGVDAGNNADSFVIAKATEGVGYVDPMCDKHIQKAIKDGKLIGVYHFARPDKNKAVDEADWFVKNIKGYIGKAILVLDYEVKPYSDNWAYTFMCRVHEQTGVWPMFYASASKINDYTWARTAAVSGLWIAGYPKKYDVPVPPKPEVKDMFYKIGDWKFWCIWQYSSSAGSLDRDIANLDSVQWLKYAGSSDPEPTPPVPADDFLPDKGYWRSEKGKVKGDTAPQIASMAAFMRKNFPAYTPAAALGSYFGKNLRKSIIEFQKRTGLVADGNVGPITYDMLKRYGYKWRG